MIKETMNNNDFVHFIWKMSVDGVVEKGNLPVSRKQHMIMRKIAYAHLAHLDRNGSMVERDKYKKWMLQILPKFMLRNPKERKEGGDEKKS